MKGVELPINTLIIIVIAMIVLIVLIALFSGVTPGINSVNLESAKNNACQKLMSMGCLPQTNTISISEFDADNDGVTGGDEVNPLAQGYNNLDCASATIDNSGDNLFMLCKCQYQISGTNDQIETSCKKNCGCS